MLFNLKKSALLFAVGLLSSAAIAQDGVLAPETREEPKAPLEQRLFEAARDPSIDFQAVYDEAIEAGKNEQELLIPSAVNALSMGDIEGAKAFFPKLDAAADEFSFGMGATFASKKQFEGFIDTMKAAVAFQEQEVETFETHAVEAFLKAPQLVRAFGIDQMMMRVRQDEIQADALASAVVPMDMVVSSVGGEAKTLKEWLGDDKALLIDFWASWCGPCIRLMPGLKRKSEELGTQGIVVVAMNTDDGAGQKDAAVKVQSQQAMESVTWLLDNNGGDLSSMLYIDSIPRMVLVSPEGKVLYNGHPQDPELGAALAKLDVTLSKEG